MKSLDEIKCSRRLIIGRTGIDGGSGEVHMPKWKGSVIWSNGGGWEHVSVAPYKQNVMPDWDDMCRLKQMFFYPEEIAVQYHPRESEYVSNVNNCLHLWRPTREEMPEPPASFVGVKSGQTYGEAIKDAKVRM